jgi:RimJ/RimL family protein N-acetyltransferase
MEREITNYHPIYSAFGERSGYLQTIRTKGHKAVEIEYFLDENQRGKGIMTAYLPEYLQQLEREGIKNVTAHVKETNYVSKKLLKRNGFNKISQFGNIEIFLYIAGMKLDASSLRGVGEEFVNRKMLVKVK